MLTYRCSSLPYINSHELIWLTLCLNKHIFLRLIDGGHTMGSDENLTWTIMDSFVSQMSLETISPGYLVNLVKYRAAVCTYPALQICTLRRPRVAPSPSFVRTHTLPNAPFSVKCEWIRDDDEENPTFAMVINLDQKQQGLVIRDELALGGWLNSSTSCCITEFCWQGWVVFHGDCKAVLMSDRWSYQAGQDFCFTDLLRH